MNNISIDVVSSVVLAGCSSNLNVGHYVLASFFFIPAMLIILIDTIDFSHFMPLSLTLTLAGGHKVSAKQNPHGFIFIHTCQLMLKKFKLNILILLLSEI